MFTTFTSTKNGWKKAMLSLALICGVAQATQAQKYTTITPSPGTAAHYLLGIGGSGFATVSSAGNVADGDNTNFATIAANSFSLAGILNWEGEGWIQMKFPSPIPAGRTTYYRIDMPTSTGLTVPVGQLLNTLLGSGLFGGGPIIAEVYTGATAVSDGTQITTGLSGNIVKDVSGNYYIAITSTSAYNSVRVRLWNRTALLSISLGSTLSMNVYYGKYDSVSTCTGRPDYTDVGQATGITASVLDSVVRNATNAIDGSATTASTLGSSSLLGLSVAGTVSQSIYFKAPALSTDNVKLMITVPGASLLTLGLFDSIKVSAYNGNTLVSRQGLSSLLRVSLLTLGGSTAVPIYMNPGGAFDRVVVSMSKGVGASLIANGINIYDAQFVPEKPVLSKDTVTIYQYTQPSVTATIATTGSNQVNWYNNAYTNIGTGTAFPTTDTISTSNWYFAHAARISCTNLSDTGKVYIRVIKLTHTDPIVGTRGVGYSGAVASIATGGFAAAGFKFALASGSTLPAGLTLNPNGTITGTPSTSDTLTFTANITDTVNGISAGVHTFQIIIRNPVTLATAALPGGNAGTPYTTTIPAATGGTGNFTYSLSGSTPLPAGVTFNPTTRTVSGTAATPGTYNFTINVIDNEGRTASANYSFIMAAPLPLTLLSFNAGLNNAAAVTVRWKTSNESNLLSFVVERSTDGQSWSSVAAQHPNNDVSVNTYTVTDAISPNWTDIMYRLKITEYNQMQYYSPVIRLGGEGISGISIDGLYPNPASAGNTVSFAAKGLYTASHVVISDARGAKVQVLENVSDIQLGNLAPGVYQVSITIEGQTFNKSLVIR
jgi:hypothetical protein